MNDVKIIFTGPAGCGKATAIAVLADEPPVHTRQIIVEVVDEEMDESLETTVAMSYGNLCLPDQQKIHLYGVAEQERSAFIQNITTPNALGLVLLVANTAKDPRQDIAFFLELYRDYINETAVVVGITHTDITPLLTLEGYHQQLKECGFSGAVFEVDARSYQDMSCLVQTLLFTIDPALKYSA